MLTPRTGFGTRGMRVTDLSAVRISSRCPRVSTWRARREVRRCLTSHHRPSSRSINLPRLVIPSEALARTASRRVGRDVRSTRACASVVRADQPQISSSSAFCACSRFSAWSPDARLRALDHLVVISSPRWAGRQCSTIASGGASAISARVDAVAGERLRRASASSSWPIEAQTSVETTCGAARRLGRVAGHA